MASKSVARRISVWLDETSEGRDAAKWIVSLDDDDGTTTLSVHTDRDSARAAAAAEAATRNGLVIEEVRA